MKRGLSEVRASARVAGAKAFAEALERHGATDAELASGLGRSGDKAGAEARQGSLVLTVGEVALLAPFKVSADTLLELLTQRVALERTRSDRLQLKLAETHLDALRVLLLSD